MILYAIVDRRPARRELLGKGIARGPLTLVRTGKAYVVVEQGSAREPTRAAIVAYDRVVRRLVRLSPAVLPLRFGSVVQDRTALQALVAPLAEPIERALECVRDAVQFTLRVSGSRPVKAVRAATPDRRAGPGTRWLADRIARHQVPEIDSVAEATRPFVRAVRSERVDQPPRIATVYHLVARENVQRWRNALRRSLATVPRGVQVTMTGPWPAWAFAELA